MDPLAIASLITGGGSLLSSIFGGLSEHEANQLNRQLMEQDRRDAKLGATDARGTRTYFKEGVGWVTEYGPTDQMLEDYFLNMELPERQDQFLRASQASRREDDTANALLDEFGRIERANPNDIENMLYAAASRGIAENTGEAMEVATRSAMRRGYTNLDRLMESITESGNEALADAAVNSKLQALDFVNNQFDSQRSNTTNLYNSFAGRARADLAPTTGPATSSTVGVVGSQPVGQQVQPDNGFANAIGGGTAALGGIFGNIGANQRQNETNELLRSFLSGYGGGSIADGGIFGDISSRARDRGGVF